MNRRRLAAAVITTTLAPGAAALAEPQTIFSPGIVIGGVGGDHPMRGFNAGVEMTLNRADDAAEYFYGYGGLLQLEVDLDGDIRLGLGGQVFGPGVGAELALSATLTEHGPHIGAMLAPFLGIGYANAALRLFFDDTGVDVGGAATLKLPFDEDGLYAGPLQQNTVEGRPHRDAHGRPIRPIVLDLGPRPDTDPAIADLPAASRHPLGRAWLRDALDEHAAIAAFAQLARHLTHHRAPPTLIARARRSARDEARHARACLDLASRLLGRHLALATPPTDTPPPDLATLALDSHLDGRINEGAAALTAAHAAARATHPRAAATRAAIAPEEARHAALGADIAAWAAATDPTARRALTAARPADPDRLHGPLAPHGDHALWTRYGRVDPQTRRDAWHAAMA